MENTRTCVDCKGAGEHVHAAFRTLEGKLYPERRYPCHTCEGRRELPVPDFGAIFLAITTARGASKGKRRFRNSPPELWKQSNRGLANHRAYYVWRWARFHGGADVTMPMTAEMFAGRDAYARELDLYAQAVAAKVFGVRRSAGAARWARALGHDVPREPGEPASATESGPVADEFKPLFECLELR